MKKQYAVFGLGSFGESIAVTLQRLGCEVVAVDNHMERVQEISDLVSYAMKADIGDADVIRTMGAGIWTASSWRWQMIWKPALWLLWCLRRWECLM